jgi:hypothetical protein
MSAAKEVHNEMIATLIQITEECIRQHIKAIIFEHVSLFIFMLSCHLRSV